MSEGTPTMTNSGAILNLQVAIFVHCAKDRFCARAVPGSMFASKSSNLSLRQGCIFSFSFEPNGAPEGTQDTRRVGDRTVMCRTAGGMAFWWLFSPITCLF